MDLLWEGSAMSRLAVLAVVLVAALLGGAVFVGITMEQRMEVLEAEVEAREAEVEALRTEIEGLFEAMLPVLLTRMTNHENTDRDLGRDVWDLEYDVQDLWGSVLDLERNSHRHSGIG